MSSPPTATALPSGPENELGDLTASPSPTQPDSSLDSQLQTESVQFRLLASAAEALDPDSVRTFQTEAEARSAFSMLQNDTASRGRWAEVARTGGGRPPAVVAWSGRAFPPVSESQLITLFGG